MINRKGKGTAAERELIHMFWEHGWAAFRAAGSGSVKYAVPDVIAGNNIRKLALEAKSTGDERKYFSQEDIDKLQQFSTIFGAEPWFAIRFSQKRWYFVNIEDLDKTEKQYVISADVCERRGLSFEQLIGKF